MALQARTLLERDDRVANREARALLAKASDLLVIDGVVLWDFDYIDLGRIRMPSYTVPVTIKSLVFSEDPRGPRPRQRLHHREHAHDREHDHEHHHDDRHHHRGRKRHEHPR